MTLRSDRPELGLREGDSVAFSSKRPGFDGEGLYALCGGYLREPSERYWTVERINPVTTRGTPRKRFKFAGMLFYDTDIGTYVQVYRIVASYRQESGIGCWED